MDPSLLLELQHSGYIQLDSSCVEFCLMLITKEPVINSAHSFLLNQTKKGGGQLLFDSGEDEEEDEGTTKEHPKAAIVPGQKMILPYWMKWLELAHRYASAVGIVGTRTLKSVRDARRESNIEEDQQYQYKASDTMLHPRKGKRPREPTSSDDEAEERDKADMKWFEEDDEDLVPLCLDLTQCIVFFKQDINHCYQFRAFEKKEFFAPQGMAVVTSPTLVARGYYEIKDVVWKVFEGPDITTGVLNSRVSRCLDWIRDENLIKDCYRTAAVQMSRPLMVLEQQIQAYKGENTAGFDSFSKGLTMMGDGQTPGTSLLDKNQKVVTSFSTALEETKKNFAKQVEELTQTQANESGQVLLPTGRKLVPYQEPRSPDYMIELFAQRKQRCWEIFGIPPGIQQQLNPFEGKAAAQEGSGTGAGSGGGGGQRVLSGLTPTAEAFMTTLENERLWYTDYGNEILDRATTPHRIRKAAMCRRDKTSHPRTHNPDNHKMRFVINSVPSLDKTEELYRSKEIQRDFMTRVWSRFLNIPLSQFNSDEALQQEEEKRQQIEQPAKK